MERRELGNDISNLDLRKIRRWENLQSRGGVCEKTKETFWKLCSDKFPINQYKMNRRNIGMKGYKLLYDYFLNWKLTALQYCDILYHTIKRISHQFSSVQFNHLVHDYSMKPSTLLILCRPLFLPYSIFPSIRVFTNESVLCISWPKYWSFTFSFSSSYK